MFVCCHAIALAAPLKEPFKFGFIRVVGHICELDKPTFRAAVIAATGNFVGLSIPRRIHLRRWFSVCERVDIDLAYGHHVARQRLRPKLIWGHSYTDDQHLRNQWL